MRVQVHACQGWPCDVLQLTSQSPQDLLQQMRWHAWRAPRASDHLCTCALHAPEITARAVPMHVHAFCAGRTSVMMHPEPSETHMDTGSSAGCASAGGLRDAYDLSCFACACLRVSSTSSLCRTIAVKAVCDALSRWSIPAFNDSPHLAVCFARTLQQTCLTRRAPTFAPS